MLCNDALLPRATHTITPILRSRELRMRYRTKRRKRKKKKKRKNLHSHLGGVRSRIDSSACGNAIKILHPRKRRFCIYFGSWSPRAEMHINIFIPPSREYDPRQSRIDSSACGNAIKILHPRKRRFCNYFGAQSPRAEMHMKIYISPSREYYPAPTIPLAEMQPKYCISASGYFVIILVPA